MLTINNNFLYAGTSCKSVWKRSLQDIIGIENINKEIPAQYYLSQNYPNPFNPTTKIDYAIPKNGFVTLKIFDVLGREIKTLISENKNAGFYSVDFNGADFQSGFYFYKLESNGFSDVKKMILIK